MKGKAPTDRECLKRQDFFFLRGCLESFEGSREKSEKA